VSARDEILGRVRAALADAPAVVPPPRDYRTAGTPSPPSEELVELFVERVSDYRATVVRCSAEEVVDRIATALDGARTVVPAGLPWEVADAVAADGLTALDLDAIEAVVTTAAVGIAETGTVVLDHSAGQGRRALSLVPDLHVVVIAEENLVAGVPEAVGRLDPLRPQTWISGPSATSDIELNRVEGVHGPRRLVVILSA
jgi:L-lactate dehydrogenase complex protein LldG